MLMVLKWKWIFNWEVLLIVGIFCVLLYVWISLWLMDLGGILMLVGLKFIFLRVGMGSGFVFKK